MKNKCASSVHCQQANINKRAGPREKNGKIITELSFLLSLTIKTTWKKFGSPEINLRWWNLKLKKMARAQGKMR